MVLEEKIERLTLKLDAEDLSVRSLDFKAVMTRIEEAFLAIGDENYEYNGWLERIGNYQEIKFDLKLYELMDLILEDKTKYWWILIDPPFYQHSRHRLFEATKLGGKALIQIFRDSPIFVVDKKYEWMKVILTDEKILKEKTKL